MKKLFFVELTDLFGGELNYSTVNRYKIEAVSMLGAVQKLARYTGLNFRKQYGDAWEAVYFSRSKASGFTIEEIDGDFIAPCYTSELS